MEVLECSLLENVLEWLASGRGFPSSMFIKLLKLEINHYRAPDPDVVKTLIKLYDVSADFILGLSDDMGQAGPAPGTSKAQPKITKVLSAEDAEILKKIESLSPEAKKKADDYLEMLKTLQEVKTGDAIDFKEKA